jgi:hypothetical protein
LFLRRGSHCRRRTAGALSSSKRMKNTILVALMIFSQAVFSQRFSHALRAVPERTASAGKTTVFPDTLRILTIRVQFQTDSDTRTSGDGRFDLSATTERIIDAPPHDSAYVADHFIFAQRYFAKASNGKQHIATTVLGRVITLNRQMKEYAPISGNLPLGQLAEESWKAADSLYPGFPFDRYDLFAIVHAGVGRDIDLRAALGYDPTPLDLPSLYFSHEALKTLFGPTYPGITLKNSTHKITNSVILPETEVRRIPSVGGDFVLKLGINGLIVASIGSHLGLPDLFDTKTGKSGIGRFGLMDGQSIFSFSGIAPPEPNAWEKAVLGWTAPIEVKSSASLSIPAVGIHQTGNDTVYRIPISANEYYLVENRFRDVKGDGQTVTMKWNGQTITKTFTRDEDFFINSNIDSVYGVVLDVDELDWSLPGIINDNNTYRGGILVWHIDETIIRANRSANTVNADPQMRGVDLEEADGSQDIGQTYDFGSPASGSEDGWSFDYWYQGNSFPLYKNEFSETTIPNTLSNTRAHSLVSLKNFSSQSPRMTFDAVIGSADIQRIGTIKRSNMNVDRNDAPFAYDLNGDGKKEIIYTSGDSIFVLKQDMSPFLNNGTGLFAKAGGRFQPAPLKLLSTGETVLTALHGGQLLVFRAADANADNLADTLYSKIFSSPFSTPPMTYSVSTLGQSHIVAGDQSGRMIDVVNSAPGVWNSDSTKIFSSAVKGFSRAIPSLVYSSDTVRIIGTRTSFNGRNILAMTSRGEEENYLLFNDNTFGVLRYTGLSASVEYHKVPEPVTGAFAVYDINADGALDLLIGAGNKLYVYNSNGVIIERFPFATMDGGSVKGSPIVAKRKGSEDVLIVFGTSNGHLYAVDSKGRNVAGFPLQTGGTVSSPFLWDEYLAVGSTDSMVNVWKIGGLIDTSRIMWSGYLADPSHSNYLTASFVSNKRSNELLPKKFAYNWPNPVYSGSTNIRYFLGKPATVKITIVNLAGEKVEELVGPNQAGLDNEVQWNITNIQSGIYFAQITASGSGEEMSQIVKIAVVK